MVIDTNLLLTLATVALAGFVQSVTGFGFGLMAMALLPLLIGFQDAYFIIMIPNLVVCAMNFLANYRHYQWRQGMGLLLGSCAAVPLGFYTMIATKPEWLMFGLGLLICAFSASELLMPKTRPLKLAESWGWPLGLLSGYLSGAFNMGGPPAVAYAYSQCWSKEHVVALLQLVFGSTSIIRLMLMQGNDQITSRLLWVSLLAIVPLLVAIYGGNWLLKRIDRRHLRMGVFLFLFVIGAKDILGL